MVQTGGLNAGHVERSGGRASDASRRESETRGEEKSTEQARPLRNPPRESQVVEVPPRGHMYVKDTGSTSSRERGRAIWLAEYISSHGVRRSRYLLAQHGRQQHHESCLIG